MSDHDETTIRELRGELARANKTIAALLEQSEIRSDSHAGKWLTLLEQQVQHQTRALAESEAQLREVTAELHYLEGSRSEFISVAAHELRTPLTGIVGYLDLVTEGSFGKLSESMARPISALRRNANRLVRLVEELLDVSEIDAGRVMLTPAQCSLATIAGEVVEELMPLALEKQQSLTVVARAHPTVSADEDKLHRAVEGLLANAIRSAPTGGQIRVVTDYPPQDLYTGDWARIRVRDNGPGIPRELQQRIFAPFSGTRSAKYHTSTGPDAAGLGLYIARGLVELHRGMITVDSVEGAYTELSVLLPLHVE